VPSEALEVAVSNPITKSCEAKVVEDMVGVAEIGLDAPSWVKSAVVAAVCVKELARDLAADFTGCGAVIGGGMRGWPEARDCSCHPTPLGPKTRDTVVLLEGPRLITDVVVNA
jgi:hypothetical protein